jgi:hypothetical protein
MLILVADLHISTNEEFQNGQLMQLALEAVDKAAKSPQNNDQSKDLTYDTRDNALPPVCAL